MDKETLQKKIESGETVWLARSKKTEKLKLHKDYFIDRENKLCECNKNHTILLGVYKLDQIFATKEEAELELEFGNITFTEKLKLPSWEQIQENIDWGIDCANRKWCLLKSRGHSIIRIEDWNSNGIYEEPLTYENYLEACRLCKKLFLGEEL